MYLFVNFNIFYMDFGPRFKEFLKENKITQAQFCEDNGLNKPLVSRYLNGEKPSADFIYTVINAYPELDLRYLFSLDDKLNYVNEESATYNTNDSLNIINDIEIKLKKLKGNVTSMTHQ